jgi:hypothetical protein
VGVRERRKEDEKQLKKEESIVGEKRGMHMKSPWRLVG